MDHALSFPPGGDEVWKYWWVVYGCRYDVADTMVCEVCGENPLVEAKKAFLGRVEGGGRKKNAGS